MNNVKILIGLDFDGVLHPFGKTNFENKTYFIDFVKNLQKENLEVNIVITSSWRYNHSLLELSDRYLSELRCEIIGKTKINHANEEDRASEFLEFVEETQNLSNIKYDIYFCLDDNDFLFKKNLDILYKTNYNNGFTKEDANILFNRIKNNLDKFKNSNNLTYKNRF